MSNPTLEELDAEYGYKARYAFEKYFKAKNRQYVKNLLPLYAEGCGFEGGDKASNGVIVFTIGEEAEGLIAVTDDRDKAYTAMNELMADWGMDFDFMPKPENLKKINLWVYNKPDGHGDGDPDWNWFEYDSKHPGARPAWKWEL
jgi:hypothetical protein